MENVRNIVLPNGSTLEVTINPGFLEKVASQFNLNEVKDVSNEHIRMYIFGAFKNAIDKVENVGFGSNFT
jgi:hypothetical protein